MLPMDFILSLLRLRLARFPCFGFYFCPFLPFLHYSPPLLVHSHQWEGGSCCLIFPVIFFLEFCVRLHSQESSDFLITDDFWPLPHRNDPKLDFFSLSFSQTAQSTPLAWSCFSCRLFPIVSPSGPAKPAYCSVIFSLK